MVRFMIAIEELVECQDVLWRKYSDLHDAALNLCEGIKGRVDGKKITFKLPNGEKQGVAVGVSHDQGRLGLLYHPYHERTGIDVGNQFWVAIKYVRKIEEE